MEDFERMLKDLKDQYNQAVKMQPDYDRKAYDYSNQFHPNNFAIEGRTSIAELARAMVEVARYIDDQKTQYFNVRPQENTKKLQ